MLDDPVQNKVEYPSEAADVNGFWVLLLLDAAWLLFRLPPLEDDVSYGF